jgi:tetratricopeptide (TPR) repeat protein
MADQNWYRLKTWSATDKLAFMQRLGRSRGAFHKAQYLRIQAYCLVTEIKEPLYQEALELLNLLVSEYPDASQLASAYMQMSRCYSSLNNEELALQAIELSITAQTKTPHVKTEAYLDFVEIVIERKLTDRYADALEKLEKFGQVEVFPISIYRSSRAKALIYDELGNIQSAKVFARRAIDASQMSESPFSYHKKLGLVDSPEATLHRRLERLST